MIGPFLLGKCVYFFPLVFILVNVLCQINLLPESIFQLVPLSLELTNGLGLTQFISGAALLGAASCWLRLLRRKSEFSAYFVPTPSVSRRVLSSGTHSDVRKDLYLLERICFQPISWYSLCKIASDDTQFSILQDGQNYTSVLAIVSPLVLKGTGNALYLPGTEKTCPPK